MTYNIQQIHPHPELQAQATAWSLGVYSAVEVALKPVALLVTPALEPITAAPGLQLTADSLDVLRRATGVIDRFGPASRAFLLGDFTSALVWAQARFETQRGVYERFAGAVIRTRLHRFERRYFPQALWAERYDEQLRQAYALRAPGAYVALHKYAYELICRAAKRWPRYWHVTGKMPEDVASDCALDLIENFSEVNWPRFERKIGEPAVYAMLDDARRRAKRRKRFFDVNAAEATSPDDLVSYQPTPEQYLMGKDRDAYMRRSLDAAKANHRVSKIDQQWLAAFRLEATQPDSRFNLARAAANMGRDRSQASRAWDALRPILASTIGTELDD